MQYVDTLQTPASQIATKMHISLQETSKVPLYLASIIALVGGVMEWSLVVGAGITAWIFFFLRWLRRLEALLNQVHMRLQQVQSMTDAAVEPTSPTEPPELAATSNSISLVDQFRTWIFQGNPVLKVAIVIGKE
jgi:hypothetical protein